MEEAVLRKRIDELLALKTNMSISAASPASELIQGSLTVLQAAYGATSPQFTLFQKVASGALAVGVKPLEIHHGVMAAEGSLKNLKAELEAGMVGSLRHRLTAEVLTDLLQLSRLVLDESNENAKNVAAVLAAAAFEDTIRRMGTVFASVAGRPDLQDVITALKSAGVLLSPQLGIAQSFLSFRNHALHADWNKIERTSVQSILAFIQELLLKHFQ